MEIAEIKARLPILQVLHRYGLKPDSAGRLRCPFHDDTTPSLQIYPATIQRLNHYTIAPPTRPSSKPKLW